MRKLFFVVAFMATIIFPVQSRAQILPPTAPISFKEGGDVALWEKELSNLEEKDFSIFSYETDFDLMGTKGTLTMIYHEELCGAYNCPLKLVVDGREILNVMAPFVWDTRYEMEKRKRAFFPAILIRGNVFQYDYKEGFYRRNHFLSGTYPKEPSYSSKFCDSCSQTIPYNIFKSDDFPIFKENAFFEMNDSMRVGQPLLKTLKKIDSFSKGFSGEFSKQEGNDLFNKYILYLHGKLKNKENNLCHEVFTENLKTQSSYWGLLNAVFFMGLYDNGPQYDIRGKSRERYIFEGSASLGVCVFKKNPEIFMDMSPSCPEGECIE